MKARGLSIHPAAASLYPFFRPFHSSSIEDICWQQALPLECQITLPRRAAITQTMKGRKFLHTVIASHAVLQGSSASWYPNDPRCAALNTDGGIRDGFTHSWIVQNFTLDTFQHGETGASTTNARFTLRTSLLADPIICSGIMHPADVYEFQGCTAKDARTLEDPWISFNYNFLLDNYLQINETWRCRRDNQER